ncbi:thiamine pyrophosphate-binding protein [Streptomyces sp. BRA346]|uniref:thiamine pyrophosphate-binding protein n=1 Tax=Streptomyces sp. BRA346 TaxID=2878199 RepID=UPI0040640CEE
MFGVANHDVDPLVTALTGERETPEFVHVRHEESAALMACAHAKLTGRTGCCLASSGSGILHLLSGLYDAALDRQPVVALIGQEPPPAGGGRRAAVRATYLFAEASAHCGLRPGSRGGRAGPRPQGSAHRTRRDHADRSPPLGARVPGAPRTA